MSARRLLSQNAWLYGIALLLTATACELEKEVEIELPPHESVPVVECYLEPGKPFALLLTRTNSYFAPFPQDDLQFLTGILEDSAEVIVRHKGTTYVLQPTLGADPHTFKVFNYYHPGPVPEDYTHAFELEIRLKDGSTIRARTRLLPVVPIDSVVVDFGKGDKARVLTYFTDPVETEDYYRRMLHESSLDSLPHQDFVSTDQFLDSEVGIFGSSYEFEEGDTVINTLFHIEKAYAEFLESLEGAIGANGNPFGQPSTILTNLEGDAGAIGIFTTLSYDRVVTIISR